jgi:hypothetical protein
VTQCMQHRPCGSPPQWLPLQHPSIERFSMCCRRIRALCPMTETGL